MNSHTELLTSLPDDLDHAAALLQAGEVVAFPTETVYGLGAVVCDEAAVRRVFQAKGRPADNPLIVHCASLADVERVARDIPERFRLLFEQFCPGPLTMLLPRHGSVPNVVTAGLETVAVRFPRHPTAIELIRRVGAPLVAPSANRSGYPSPTTAQHVMDDLGGRIAAVVDGGTCEIGLESTVVNILTEPPVVLRPGVITRQMLAAALQEPVVEAIPASVSTPASPGMKYRHYAPDAQVQLVDSFAEAVHLHEQHLSSWILTSPQSQSQRSQSQRSLSQRSLSQRGLQATAIQTLTAATLYETLRRADAEGIQMVIVVCDAALRADAALMNRLHKAAARV
jgi:L-threonylcarbamoyladenylate synthase